MIIGIDLDAVCADYYGGLRKFIALEDGLTPELAMELYPDPDTYDMGSWNGFPDKFLEIHTRAVEQGLYRNLEPIEGASETLWKLNDDGHHLRVITSRFVRPGQHASAASQTVAWLDNFGFPYHDISFVKGKGDIYADVYIDDSPENIHRFNELGRKVIIFNTSYNKDIDGLRAYNWNDVYHIISDLSNK